jgi:hypothetical protein
VRVLGVVFYMLWRKPIDGIDAIEASYNLGEWNLPCPRYADLYTYY